MTFLLSVALLRREPITCSLSDPDLSPSRAEHRARLQGGGPDPEPIKYKY